MQGAAPLAGSRVVRKTPDTFLVAVVLLAPRCYRWRDEADAFSSFVLRGAAARNERTVVLAEEWHCVDAVLHLDWLLRQIGLRDCVDILWNATGPTFKICRSPSFARRSANALDCDGSTN